MSFIGNEGIAPTIQLDSVGIGFQVDANGNAINVDGLDLNRNEYLVVGEKTYYPEEDNQKNTKWNLLVNSDGVAVNTSRNLSANFLNSDTSLFVDKNIYCAGIVKAAGLELNDIILDGDPLTSSLIRDFIINANNISANQPFQAGLNTSYNDVYNYNYYIKNVFTPNFITLGGHVDTYNNTHPLNIVSTANNKFNSMHVAIRNDTNNEEEPTKFAFGIIGGSNISPAIISTTRGTPLEFHISKSSSSIEELYGSNAIPSYDNSNQYPALAIDENNNVGIGINKTNNRDFTRKTLYNGEIINEDIIDENIKFQVNGISCFDEILMYDYYTKSHKALDDIYVRTSGISVINATQISEGDFLGNLYNFNNIGVNDLLSTNKLQVNTDIKVDNNIHTESLIVNNVANFTGVVQFDNEVNFTNSESININKLKVADDIYIGNRKIIPIDIDDPSTGYGTYSRSEDGSNYFFVYVHSNIATLDANCNISFPRKLAVGLTETNGFEGVLNIIKDDVTTSNNFDITLKNIVESKEYYANIGRLSRLDFNDNSLILNTNKVTGKRNNIYFYPETDMSELTSNYYLPNIKNVPPTMSMNKERVGINKYAARVGYELDVEGNVAARDYYLTVGNEMHRTRNFIYQSKNYFNIYDTKTDKFCINYNNLTSHASTMKGLNVKQGINSDYYYQNDKIIETLQIANNTDSFYTNKKISIGWHGENVNAPLQIRNLTTDDYNYSVIRIYRGVRGGGLKNNADYSGIDICEYDRNLGGDRNSERWFIYKNHTFNDIDSRNVYHIGPLQIGYIDKDIKPKTYGMSFYYNTLNSNYHIDVNKSTVSYEDNNSAMSIYGDLDVHGNINIIDKYGSNYNFRLSNLEKLTKITQYITTETLNTDFDDINGLSIANNDIRYTGNNIIYSPNRSVIVDSIENKAISMIVKQENSNLPVTKFITYSDNNLECSSCFELAIYNSNFSIADDDYDKKNNINNLIKFNLSSDNEKNASFDMSFFHNNYYKSFYNFKNNIDESGNILWSSTHIGVGNNIVNNSNVAFHIDDNNKYGIQITNNNYAPAINLLYTGSTSNIYHTLSGSSFENNYRFSIGVANKSTFNEPETSNVFIIDAFDGNDIRKGARFGFNDDILAESFVIKTDYDTSAMAITSRYTSEYIFDSIVDISPENLILTTLSSDWNNSDKEYIVTYNYSVSDFPDFDNNLNSISEVDKVNPNFIFKSSISLNNNITYKTFHSDLDITYNVSNLNVNFINYEPSIINSFINNVDNTTNCSLTFNTNSYTCNIVLNPNLSFDNNTIIAEDLKNNIIDINNTFITNLTLIDDVTSNYKFTYNYRNIILLPEYLSCNITYLSEFNSNIFNNSNMLYNNNKIFTDILPFDSNEFYYEYINSEIDTKSLNDNGIYTNIFLQTTTSNIVRINSNIDLTGTFFVERDNTFLYKTSNILPDALMNSVSTDNRLEYSYNINIENGSSNLYILSSNFVVNNNINNISRDLILLKINSNYLIEDNFEIYGYNFTNKIYFEEYFNKLSDTQSDDYIIRIKNYNYKNFKPHITLANDVNGLNKIAGHEIYSYDGVLEIKYIDSSENDSWVPLKIDADGNTFIKGGLEMSGDIKFDGKIYDANGNDLIEILNKNYYKEYEINSSNIHFNSYGSNGVEIHAYSSSNYDDFKFFYAQDFLDEDIVNNVMILHKIFDEEAQYKLDVFGDIRAYNNIYSDKKIGIKIENPYVAMDINTTDSIKIPKGTSAERPVSGEEEDIDLNIHKGYIRYNIELDQFEGFGAGNKWGSLGGIKDVDGDTYISAENSAGDDNDELKFFTKDIERMVITSNGLIGIGTTNPDYTVDIFGTSKISDNLYINNKIGINTETPYVSIHINTTDSIKIPKGTTAQRPVDNHETDITHKGYIRYNTELDQFEGFGAGNTWGSLGGIKDVDGDTYISAENNAGDDNDELKFFTKDIERMVITSNGLIGIGTTSPYKNLTIYSENATLSIQDPRNNINAVSSIELVNGSNNNFDNNEENYGWKISNSNELFSISSGSNNIVNDRFIVDGKTGNIGIGIKPHIYDALLDEDEFKFNISGALNVNGDIYKDGTLFFGGGNGGGAGIISQNMSVQTITKNYTETRIMSENVVNVVPDDGWLFIDNNLDTGFVIKIKPSHRKSKILLNLSCHIGFDSSLDSRWWGLKLYRMIEGGNWTEVKSANGNYNSETNDNGDLANVGGSTACWISHNLGANLSSYENFVANISGSFCDSPDSRVNVYYTVKWKSRLGDTNDLSGDGDLYLNRPAKYNGANTPVLSSSWAAHEIWQLGTPYIPSEGSNIITLYNQERVGIGNTEPTYELDLSGNFRSDSNIFVDGKIGINTYLPAFTIDMNTDDGIKIPAGHTSNRPSDDILTNGVIRYNTETDHFEGYGAGAWGSLGGVIDIDQDTYIKAEKEVNADNDELQFVTDGTERMIIKKDGKIGINTYLPIFSLDLHTTDGIKIPTGNTNQRPDSNIITKGVIRYNNEIDQFEGYGAGDIWGSLGGVKDVNGNTYISAENNPGDDNDEIKFFTKDIERMVITSNGDLGIGTTSPNYKIDVDGEINARDIIINGTPLRLEIPSGMTLQTKHLTYTNTCTKSDTETDWVPVDNNITSGFVIKVKPTHTSSKILLNLICHIGMDYLQDSRWWGLKLYRKIGDGNWTEVSGANGTSDYNGTACWISHNLGAESSIYSHSITNVTGSYEDEPATTENVYYTIYWKSRLDGTSGKLYLNKSAESYDDNYPKPSSSWTASEIWNTGVPYVPHAPGSVISLSGDKVGIGIIPEFDSSYKLDVIGNIKCHNLFQTSDKRYKKNIEHLDSALHLIDGINPVTYNTENDTKIKYGFIAQDLENIIPNIVNIPNNTNDLYSIDYISMIPLLTKSIQELYNIINNQQKEINELKSKL